MTRSEAATARRAEKRQRSEEEQTKVDTADTAKRRAREDAAAGAGGKKTGKEGKKKTEGGKERDKTTPNSGKGTAVAPAAVGGAPQAIPKFCSDCGSKFAVAGAKFCSNCGAPAPAPAPAPATAPALTPLLAAPTKAVVKTDAVKGAAKDTAHTPQIAGENPKDWKCPACGNINWAKRTRCNSKTCEARAKEKSGWAPQSDEDRINENMELRKRYADDRASLTPVELERAEALIARDEKKKQKKVEHEFAKAKRDAKKKKKV